MIEVAIFCDPQNAQKAGELLYEEDKDLYVFNYTQKEQTISLIMPYKPSSYIWKRKLHPIFDMNMPEGYLFELLKNQLSKEFGRLTDYLLFSFLAPNMYGRLTYKSEFAEKEFKYLDLDFVIKNDSEDTFAKLVDSFLERNAVSGVQPKTLALLREKESLPFKEYIVKTWGAEYPQLALNEYYCLQAVKRSGVPVASVALSQNNRFLIVERFNFNPDTNRFWGFEEVVVLLGKNKDEKYNGSYEQIARTIYNATTNQETAMANLFKIIVMNYLLKNGDAHLKNFGVLYTNNPKKEIKLAPAYDIISTVAYVYRDKPALTMFGKKLWFGKKYLIRFGKEFCLLTVADAQKYYDECVNALKQTTDELESYVKTNPEFESIGSRMLDAWKFSLQNLDKTHKELPDEIIRNWN